MRLARAVSPRNHLLGSHRKRYQADRWTGVQDRVFVSRDQVFWVSDPVHSCSTISPKAKLPRLVSLNASQKQLDERYPLNKGHIERLIWLSSHMFQHIRGCPVYPGNFRTVIRMRRLSRLWVQVVSEQAAAGERDRLDQIGSRRFSVALGR